MADTAKKKHPVLLFFAVFVVIVIITFINNYNSEKKYKLFGPVSGVLHLSTCGQKIAAVSRDMEVYLWDWADLSAQPLVGSLKAKKILPMKLDRVLWSPADKEYSIVASEIKTAKEFAQSSISAGKCKHLVSSSNNNFAVAAMETNTKQVQFLVADPNLTHIIDVLTKDFSNGRHLLDIAVSNDGSLIAAVGGRNPAWIFLIDVKQKKILWDQNIKTSTELNFVLFSNDCKTVFASEPGRTVYAFNAENGNISKQFTMDKYSTPANNPQTISCIAISPDGTLLAAATDPVPRIDVWNIATGKKIFHTGKEQYTISGLAFSPDSSLLAVGILVRNTLNVWKIPSKN